MENSKSDKRIMTVKEFLGDDIICKYREIYPILLHILYRQSAWGRGGVIVDDGVKSAIYCTNPIKNVICNASEKFGKVIYPFIERYTNSRKNARILLSETFFKTNRYDTMNEQILSEYSVYRFCSYANCTLLDCWTNRKKGYEWKRVAPLFVGESVCGIRLKKIALEVFDYFSKRISENKSCRDDKELIEMLDELQDAAIRRIGALEQLLNEYNVEQFITLNQNSLNDIITIMACNKINIWTKLYLHHSLIITPIDNYDWNQKIETNWECNIMNEIDCWMQEDKVWYEKYRTLTNFAGENMKLGVVGSPELFFESRSPSQYIRDRIIFAVPAATIFMHNATEDDKFTIEEVEALKTYRSILYDKLSCLAAKYDLKVYLRYHPSERDEFIKMDEKKRNEYGFRVSEARGEMLYDELKLCKICIATASSFLILAYSLGAQCVMLSMYDEKYDLCGWDVDVIDIERLDTIKVRDINCIHQEVTVDLEKLFSDHNKVTRKQIL